MAKIEVTLDPAKVAEGYSIHGAQLQSYNDIGNLRPNGYAELNNTLEFETFSCFNQFVGENNLPSTVAQIGGLAFVQSGDNRYIIYVPECEYNDEQILVQVKKGNNDILTQNKTFPGFPMNITNLVRNHLYSYNITQINDGASLELVCQVQPWDVIEENIQFTDEVTVKQKMQWSGTYKPNTDDASILYIDNAINDATAATVTFQIDTPVGATWYANFEGDKDSFAFLDEDGNELTSITGNVGEPATLKIVTKEEHVGEMKSVSLMIVVRTMDGRTIMVNKDLMPESLKDKDYFQLRQNLSI